MTRLSTTAWEIAAWTGALALVAASAYWYSKRKRPTADELEQARRKMLVHSGRIVDGVLEEVREMESADGPGLILLQFSYRIGGVDYGCSQDISALRGMMDVAQIRAGFPCSVRYQPGNPQNSIVAAEEWNGMRMGVPALPAYASRVQKEMGRLQATPSRPGA